MENDLNVYIATEECAVRMLTPLFSQIICNYDNVAFWTGMMKLQIETSESPKNAEVVNAVINKYLEFISLMYEAKNNRFHKKIICRKREMTKENKIGELNAYKRVIKKLKIAFEDIEEQLDEDDKDESEENDVKEESNIESGEENDEMNTDSQNTED